MTFIETATEGTAAGTVDPLYAADVADQGYVANYTRVFAPRPEVLAGWAQLNGAIKHGLDLRRYELVPLAAARALRSTYCAMAHGRVLRPALTVGRAPQPGGRPTALPAPREAS